MRERDLTDALYRALKAQIDDIAGGDIAVILDGQGTPRPNMPYAALRMEIGPAIGATAAQVWETPVDDDDEPTGAAGEEVIITAHRRYTGTLTVHYFAGPRDGEASEAMRVLRRLAVAIELPGVLDELEGLLSIQGVTGIRQVPEVVDSGQVDRAVLDLLFNVSESATMRTGYIATTTITGLDWTDKVFGDGG